MFDGVAAARDIARFGTLSSLTVDRIAFSPFGLTYNMARARPRSRLHGSFESFIVDGSRRLSQLVCSVTATSDSLSASTGDRGAALNTVYLSFRLR